MQHYFGAFSSGVAYLSKEDEHHALNVKRLRLDEEVEISEGGKTYLCRASSLHPLRFALLRELKSREPSIRLSLAFSMLKSDYNELIVLKGTEIGVSEFLPFVSKRTILPLEAANKKAARLRKIAKEGAEQCRRGLIPEVKEAKTLRELDFSAYPTKLFAYEEMAMVGQSLLSCQLEGDCLLVVGPEGGFAKEEASYLLENGFAPISLGKRILRAETAAIFGCSVLIARSGS